LGGESLELDERFGEEKLITKGGAFLRFQTDDENKDERA
jgi:hypothetical protein